MTEHANFFREVSSYFNRLIIEGGQSKNPARLVIVIDPELWESYAERLAAHADEMDKGEDRAAMAAAIRFEKCTGTEHRPDEEDEGCLQCGENWPCLRERAARLIEGRA